LVRGRLRPAPAKWQSGIAAGGLARAPVERRAAPSGAGPALLLDGPLGDPPCQGRSGALPKTRCERPRKGVQRASAAIARARAPRGSATRGVKPMFNPALAARFFDEAHRQRAAYRNLPPELAAGNVEEAYAAQEALCALWQERLGRVAG